MYLTLVLRELDIEEDNLPLSSKVLDDIKNHKSVNTKNRIIIKNV